MQQALRGTNLDATAATSGVLVNSIEVLKPEITADTVLST
jgi:hypothetical protein